MLDRVPTVRARELGQTLSRAMHKAGHNATQMSELLAWSPSKTSRLLSGKRIGRQVDIAAFLAMCGVVGDRRDAVLDLAEDVYAPVWWQDHGARLPIQRATLRDNEAATTAITLFDTTLVPELLQTPDYTRALLRVLPNIPVAELDDRVAEIGRRQRVLDREHPPAVRVLLDEYVLSRTGAGDEVMSGQAHHLLRLAVRPEVEIRIVPQANGVRDTTPFALLEFADYPPVAYLEHPTSEAFLERDDTIAAYRGVIAQLERIALDENASRAWIAEVAKRRSNSQLG